MLDLISLQKLQQVYMSGRSICDAKHKVYNLLLQQFYFKSCGLSTRICPVHCMQPEMSHSGLSITGKFRVKFCSVSSPAMDV